MSQLQNILDEMKGQKLPSFTPFGRITGIKHKYLVGENAYFIRTPLAVKNFDQLGEQFQTYVRVMSTLTTAKELLKELSDAFSGHDCKASEESGCQGCI